MHWHCAEAEGDGQYSQRVNEPCEAEAKVQHLEGLEYERIGIAACRPAKRSDSAAQARFVAGERHIFRLARATINAREQQHFQQQSQG